MSRPWWNNSPIADVNNSNSTQRGPSTEELSNARLIAAAACLLEACKEALEIFKICNVIPEPERHAGIRKIVEAIRKAEIGGAE